MHKSVAMIGLALKEARQKKFLSQRALSKKTGIPQSHISKIENGEIDLQTSSLIEITRALDLELMLVPRPLIPTFQTLMRQDKKDGEEQIPAYRLEEEDSDG